MDQQKSFEEASKYTGASIERCNQLAAFMKKRLAIEEDYAKSLSKHFPIGIIMLLGKLCKSVSLTPMQKKQAQHGKGSGWFWSRTRNESESTSYDVVETYAFEMHSLI